MVCGAQYPSEVEERNFEAGGGGGGVNKEAVFSDGDAWNTGQDMPFYQSPASASKQLYKQGRRKR